MFSDSCKPSQGFTSKLTQKERIHILLAEYSALRSEIMQRTQFGFQLTAIIAGLVTWLLSTLVNNHSWRFWGVMAGIGGLLGVGIFANVRDLKRAAHQLKGLEHEINSRAGEHLLTWETLSGVLTRMGLIRSFFCKVDPFPRSELPPLDPSYLEEQGSSLGPGNAMHETGER